MSEAVPKGNTKGRGPGHPVPQGGDSNLPQHGGEGKNLQTKGGKKAGLNKDMSGSPGYAGPGRNL